MSDTTSISARIVRIIAALSGAPRAWRVVLLLLAVVVSYLAIAPTPPRELTMGWDKLNHVAAFSALAISGSFAFPRKRVLLLVLLALFAYGGLIEIIQYYVPGRSSEWADLLADSIGIVVGSLLALTVKLLPRR